MAKVLLMIENLNQGGAQRAVTQHAQILRDGGHKVCVLTFYPSDDEYALPEGVTRVNLYPNQQTYQAEICKIVVCEKLMSTYLTIDQYDVMIPYLLEANLLAAVTYLKNTQTIVLPTIRDCPWQEGYGQILQDWVCQKQGLVMVQNREQLTYFQQPRFEGVQPYVVHNVLHPDVAKHQKTTYRQIKKIVAVGRLEPQKNHILLLRTIKLLRTTHKLDVTLDIFGEGNERQRLQAYIDANGLKDYVHLRGFNPDVYAVLPEYDLFVLTSEHEGMPNALMEAMGCGLPVVATKCRTGIKELIKHGSNGWVTPMHDAEALAQLLVDINQQDLLAAAGKQALQDVQRYTAENCGQELLTTLKKVLKNRVEVPDMEDVWVKLDMVIDQANTDIRKTYYDDMFCCLIAAAMMSKDNELRAKRWFFRQANQRLDRALKIDHKYVTRFFQLATLITPYMPVVSQRRIFRVLTKLLPHAPECSDAYFRAVLDGIRANPDETDAQKMFNTARKVLDVERVTPTSKPQILYKQCFLKNNFVLLFDSLHSGIESC